MSYLVHSSGVVMLDIKSRGRGSRAVMGWVKDAAVLQDSCFYSPIELHGNLVSSGWSLVNYGANALLAGQSV